MNRILVIIAVVVLVAGIAAGAYFYFFSNTAAPIVIDAGGTLPAPADVIDTPTDTPVEPAQPQAVSTKLVRIDAGPIVPGEVLVNVPASASSTPDTRVFYIQRQSGNVFSYLVGARTLTRTSNRTVPGIQEAKWLPDASLAFVRYLSGEDFSTINTYALPSSVGGGFFLSQNLADIAVSSTSILMLASGANESVATVGRPDGSRATQAFSSSLSMLRVDFAGKNQYLAFTKPSGTLPGYAYLVDAKGNFSRIAGPLNGLVAKPSPSGKWVLVSYVSGPALKMQLVHTTTREAITLPVATIADKCVWTQDERSIYCGVPTSPTSNATYPDDWYQGAVHFSDRIWKINVEGRYAEFVLDFEKEANTELDATALATDSAGRALVFVNKNDGSLWSYRF